MSNRGKVIEAFLIVVGITFGVVIGQSITRDHYRDVAEKQISIERQQFNADRKAIIEKSAVEAVNAVAVELRKTEADAKHWQEEFEKLRQLYNSTTAKLQKQINATGK